MNNIYDDIYNHFYSHNIKNIYDNDELYPKVTVKHILDNLYIHNNSNILDLGCGDGIVDYELGLIYKNCNFFCIDNSKQNIAYAQNKYLLNNIEYFHCNMLKLDKLIENINFDLIFSYNSMQYILHKDFISLNLKLKKILKDHGSIIHFSLPDIRKKLPTILVRYYRDKLPVKILKSIIDYVKFDNICSYESDGLSMWHYPSRIYKDLSHDFKITFNESTRYWYRFDIIMTKKDVRHTPTQSRRFS